MKIFVISLKSSLKRRSSITRQLQNLGLSFEFVDAVDGKSLTQIEVHRICDNEVLNKFPQWLNKGAIGCALSHKKAYERILEDNLPYAFIVEDDMILPPDLQSILDEIEDKIQNNELILLYYRTKRKILFSTLDSRPIKNYKLLYPLDVNSIPISACGYVISQEACKTLVPQILPLKNTADSWRNFYERGGFKKISVVFPSPIKDGLFKSDIDYVGTYSNKYLAALAKFINKYEIPFVFKHLKKKRGEREQSMNLFELTDSVSSFSEN